MAIEEYAQQVSAEEGVSSNGQAAVYEPVEPAGALDSVIAPEFDAQGVTDTIGEQVDFTGDYINKATDTVAGQLEGLLASDSPYIKQAKDRALEQSQARGWGGSTMMQEAGERAAIQSALPIATQDAQTWAQSALRTQDATQSLEGEVGSGIIQGDLKEQDYAFQGMENYLNRQHEAGVLEDKQIFEATQDTFNRAHQTALQNDNQEHAVALEGLQNEYKVGLTNLTNAHETMITQMNLDSADQKSMSLGMSNIMHDYMSNIQSIMTDPSFLELSGKDLDKTVNNMQTFAMNQMSFLGSVYQESNIDSWIDSAFPPITSVG